MRDVALLRLKMANKSLCFEAQLSVGPKDAHLMKLESFNVVICLLRDSINWL